MLQLAVAAAPILVLVAMLAVCKRPAYEAALAALATGAALAMGVLGLPLKSFLLCTLGGAKTGLFPIGLVIVAALFTYAIAEETGAIVEIRSGLSRLSSDPRFFALLVAWGFGNFMEGMAGFGTAVAIPCAILVGAGFDPVKAVLCCLVANTTPTAFGSVGVPTMVLAGETALELSRLSAVIALLQLAATALSPFFILFIVDGFRGLREKWALALIADVAFLVPWVLCAAALGCELPNIAGGIVTMAVLALMGDFRKLDGKKQAWAWLPFLVVVAVLGVSAALPKAYKLSPGILILAAACLGGLGQKLKPARLAVLLIKTVRKYFLALLTICMVLALAKTMGEAGMTATLAAALVKSAGNAYAAVATLVGSLGGFVTGSGTSSNVLFGALQASVGASQAEKFLFAAANVMGAGIGKMLCPQSIVLGCAAAGLAGSESLVMKRAFRYFVPVLAVASAATVVARLVCG